MPGTAPSPRCSPLPPRNLLSFAICATRTSSPSSSSARGVVLFLSLCARTHERRRWSLSVSLSPSWIFLPVFPLKAHPKFFYDRTLYSVGFTLCAVSKIENIPKDVYFSYNTRFLFESFVIFCATNFLSKQRERETDLFLKV